MGSLLVRFARKAGAAHVASEAPELDEHRSSDGSVDRASAIAETSERKRGLRRPDARRSRTAREASRGPRR